MKRKRTVVLLFALCMVLAFLPMNAEAATVAQGTCGENLTWVLDDAGTLTISGEGEMDLFNDTEQPWYRHRTKIKSLVIEEGVTRIGSMAMLKCRNLVSVSLPQSLESISLCAFEGCTALTKINIPNGVKTIAFASFRYCTALETVTIPNSVTIIDVSVFAGCTALKNIVLPTGVKYIGADAFFECSGLQSITIADSVEFIGTQAFYGCTGLERVDLPDSLIEIGSSAFYGCTGLTQVDLPGMLAELGSDAFWNCTSLKTVIFRGDAPFIGENAFLSCDKVTAYYPADYEGWTDDMLQDYGAESINWVPYWKAGSNAWVYIKDGILTVTGTGVVDYCGYRTNPWIDHIKAVRTVVVEAGITEIGSSAFAGGTLISSVSLPDGLTRIGGNVFYDCGILRQIEIPDTVTYIGEGAFHECNSLQEITIPKGVTQIDDLTFAWCTSLERVDLPDTIKAIGTDAFYQCKKLPQIDLPDSLQTIGQTAFHGCESLETIHIPETVTKIGINAFNGCTKLHAINIPDGILEIAEGTFERCPALENLVLPESILLVGENAFSNGGNLTIQFTGEAPVIRENAFEDSNITAIYPKDLAFWTKDVLQNYGARTVAWKPYGQPKFTTQPKDYFGKVGTKTTFSVKTDIDTGFPEYQWQYSTDNGKTWKRYTGTGAQTAKISVTVTEENIGTMYRCAVTDGICAKSAKSGNAQIKTPVEILEQPADGCAKLSQSAYATVKAVGKDLTYTWYFKNPGSSKYYSSTVNAPKYGTTMQQSSNGRRVYCVITDAFGNSVTSDTVTLWMAATLMTQPRDVSVRSGETAKVSVDAVGSELTYKWYYANPGRSKFYVTTAFTGNTYSLTMNDTRAGRRVYCVITDKYGNSVTTDTVTLDMAKTELKITRQPVSVTVANGATAKVTVIAEGDGLTYRWYYKNVGESSYTYTSSYTGNTYSVPMNEARNGRQVLCRVYDKYGNVVQTNTVKLSMARSTVKITQQPVSVTVAEGATAKVTVKATGDGLTYRWYYKDVGMSSYTYTASYTGNTYSVPMTKARNGRQLLCRVYDQYGNVVQTNTVTLKMS